MEPTTEKIQWIRASSTGEKTGNALADLIDLVDTLENESECRLTACPSNCSWAMEVNGGEKDAPFSLMNKTSFLMVHPQFTNAPAGDYVGVLKFTPTNEATLELLSSDKLLASLHKHNDVMLTQWTGTQLIVAMGVRSNLR